MAAQPMTTIGRKLTRPAADPRPWAPPAIPALIQRIDAALKAPRAA